MIQQSKALEEGRGRTGGRQKGVGDGGSQERSSCREAGEEETHQGMEAAGSSPRGGGGLTEGGPAALQLLGRDHDPSSPVEELPAPSTRKVLSSLEEERFRRMTSQQKSC